MRITFKISGGILWSDNTRNLSHYDMTKESTMDLSAIEKDLCCTRI
jgi:hypothetical protein